MTSRCTTAVSIAALSEWERKLFSSQLQLKRRTDSSSKIKYESDLWLYNRNLMKTLFRLLFPSRCSPTFVWVSALCKFSSDNSLFRQNSGCCCEVIRSSFSEVSCDSYQSPVFRSRRVHIAHFPLPSFRFTFCHAIHPLSFAWQTFARFGLVLLSYLNAKTAAK